MLHIWLSQKNAPVQAAALFTISGPSCAIVAPGLSLPALRMLRCSKVWLSPSNTPVQDPHGGLGPLLPGWQPRSAAPSQRGSDWHNQNQQQHQPPGGAPGGSAAASTVGDFDPDDFSVMAETAPGGAGSEAGYIQRLPDFRSMLEAALRGDAARVPSSPCPLCCLPLLSPLCP